MLLCIGKSLVIFGGKNDKTTNIYIECDDDGWVLFTGYNSEQIMRRNEMTLISHGNANNVCRLFCLLDFRLLYWELKSLKWPRKREKQQKSRKFFGFNVKYLRKSIFWQMLRREKKKLINSIAPIHINVGNRANV